jgi:hypothetical protein
MVNIKTLKAQNSNLILVFFTFNVALFYTLTFSEFNYSKIELKTFLLARGVWFLIVPLLLFILNGIISSNYKAILSFWRIKNPLPGCRAFSYYMDIDDRIDKYNLETKYEIPISPNEQNALWYKIYKKHQENPMIIKSHKDFLLARDICSIAVIFLIFGSIFVLFLVLNPIKWIYIAYLFFQYLMFSIVAQNHGKRFVCNSLAIESSN